jgi:hypothetical protein
MTNFLVALSGAQRKILGQCPSERVKFQTLGLAIFITSATSIVSMWFALTSAIGLNVILALPAALFWGLVILGIDRWLVVTMPLEGSRRWAIAMPRLILAMLLGILIATPLVLRIFQSEIDTQIVVIKQQQTSAFLASQQKSALGEQVSSLHDSVNNLQQVIDSDGIVFTGTASTQLQSLTSQRTAEFTLEQEDYRQWQCQLYGGPGCPPVGDGPLALASQQNYQHAATQVATLSNEIRQLQEASTSASSDHSRYDQAVAALPAEQKQLNDVMAAEDVMLSNFEAQNSNENGILIRLQALSDISQRNVTFSAARWLLFILFLVIECLPVTVKLIQRPGNYERLLRVAAVRELREARRVLRTSYRADAWTDPAHYLDDIWQRQTATAKSSSETPIQVTNLTDGLSDEPDEDGRPDGIEVRSPDHEPG